MKQKTKRTYKLLQISDAMSKIYKKSSGYNDSQFLNLIKNWETIVGSEYAKILTPVKVASKGSTLIVSSEKNFAVESNYIAPMLIDKINGFYGRPAFRKIDFIFKKQASLKNKTKEKPLNEEVKHKIEKMVCNVDNCELKETLERLGESMAQKGRIKK